jgi:hypothetical protein
VGILRSGGEIGEVGGLEEGVDLGVASLAVGAGSKS